MTERVFRYNPSDAVVVLADRTDIPPKWVFEVGDRQYYSITGSIGLTREVFPGAFVRIGMVNDSEKPWPDNAITAVPIEKCWFEYV